MKRVHFERVSGKLRPRKHRPQTSDLENSDAPNLENSDLENSDPPNLENSDLENSDPPNLENSDP